MPITEFVFPVLKPDPHTQSLAAPLFPELVSRIATAPGALGSLPGKVLSPTPNAAQTASSSSDEPFQPAMLVGWETLDAFEAFVTSPILAEFKARFGPLLAAPPQPLVFETDVPAMEWIAGAAGGVCDVFRVEAVPSSSSSSDGAVKDAWARLTESVAGAVGGAGRVKATQGQSLNLEQETFLGALAWGTAEDRRRALADRQVQQGIDEVLAAGKSTRLEVEFPATGA